MDSAVPIQATAAEFHLTTHWRFDAPIERVWAELTATERWPEWWPAVLQVKTLERGDVHGVGAYRHMRWRTALPYQLAFTMRTTQVIKHALIEGRSDGNLAGTGRWQLFPDGSGTRVQYDWHVAVTKPWMRFAAPLLRRVFAWNHGIVMEWGRQGLEEQLKRESFSPPIRPN